MILYFYILYNTIAADVVSVAVPFATGGGAIVKVASKADDVIDLGRTVDKVTDVADTVHDGTKALSQLEIPDCFVAGTTVTTSEGEKPIEKVQAGDYVWASDPETGEVGLKQVVKTFVNETTHVTKITVNGEEITSTQTHPYYVADKGWVLAKNLRAGDILVMLNGEHVVLEQVQHEILESPVVTYNFEVAGFHTYFVGENEILVHNKCVEELFEGFEKHAFSKQHVKDGIENLGLSHREVFDSVYGDLLTKLDQAVEKSNQFYTKIGNTDITVRFFISNGEILSINAMVGKAERIIGKLLT